MVLYGDHIAHVAIAQTLQSEHALLHLPPELVTLLCKRKTLRPYRKSSNLIHVRGWKSDVGAEMRRKDTLLTILSRSPRPTGSLKRTS